MLSTNTKRNFFVALTLAGTVLIMPVDAGAMSPAGFSRLDGLSAVQLVQEKKKPETVKQKVKRVWRNLTGYKFDIACPAFAFALSRTTCTATGKNREDARAKCQSQHVLCEVRDAR
jgi:hypothetical protein